MLNLVQVSGAAADGIRAAGMEIISRREGDDGVALNVAEVGQEATYRVTVRGIAQPTEEPQNREAPATESGGEPSNEPPPPNEERVR